MKSTSPESYGIRHSVRTGHLPTDLIKVKPPARRAYATCGSLMTQFSVTQGPIYTPLAIKYLLLKLKPTPQPKLMILANGVYRAPCDREYEKDPKFVCPGA